MDPQTVCDLQARSYIQEYGGRPRYLVLYEESEVGKSSLMNLLKTHDIVKISPDTLPLSMYHGEWLMLRPMGYGKDDSDAGTLFFGLSGTGKTTLSADPNCLLIGDDEHVWSDTECINISREKEPEIFNAIRFGSILENVVYNPATRIPDYDNVTIMENTRCAYPIEYIPKAKIPCMMERRSSNIIILTCNAFGVLDSKADFVLEKRNPRLNRFRNQTLNSPIIIRVTHSNHYSRPCHSTSFPSHRSKTFTSWLS
ncbi:PEP carboxykinase-like protein, partial [Rhizopogon salebrosus TDB-379]